MDTYREIAISKIADILSGTDLLVPVKDMWKRIYCNSGQSDLYYKLEEKLEPSINSYGYRESCVINNDYCYSALRETILNIHSDQELICFFNSVVEKIILAKIFPYDIDKILKNENYRINTTNFDLDNFIYKLKIEDKNTILRKYTSSVFASFSQNLNLLGMEICFDDNSKLCIFPFSDTIRETKFDNSLLYVWLNNNYDYIADSYINAVKSYSSGDSIGCITHCRNIITGIFSSQKEPRTKWKDGLKRACSNDKNINNVNVNEINTIKYNENSVNSNERYQYPRYNLIYKLYSFSCSLGAHANEGNLTSSGIDREIATAEDALLCLRMTEDMLIWLYQGKA